MDSKDFDKAIDKFADSKLLNKIPTSHADLFKLTSAVMSIAETKLKAAGAVKKSAVLNVLKVRFGLSVTQIAIVSDFIDVAVVITKGKLLQEFQTGCKCW